MAKAKTLYFSTLELQTGRQAFGTATTDLKSMRDKLTTGIEQLRYSGWKSDAADAFFYNIGTTWREDVRRYCDLMDVLCEVLGEACITYEKVESDAKKLLTPTW